MSRPPAPDLAAGRTQTRLALGLLFVLSAAPTLIALGHGGVENPGLKLPGFAVTAFVLWQVYRGSRLALYLTLALSVLGGLALTLLSPLGGLSLRTLVLLLVGLAFAICGLSLYAHPPIKAFLEAQRRGARPS